MKQKITLFATLMALALACNDGGSGPTAASSTPTASQAQVSLSTVPDRIVPVIPSSNSSAQWQVSFSLVIRESAGLGANVNFIELTWPGLGSVQWGATDIQGLSGSNRVNARSSLSVPLALSFNYPVGATGQTFISDFVTVVVDTTDDRGNRTSTSVRFLAQN